MPEKPVRKPRLETNLFELRLPAFVGYDARIGGTDDDKVGVVLNAHTYQAPKDLAKVRVELIIEAAIETLRESKVASADLLARTEKMKAGIVVHHDDPAEDGNFTVAVPFETYATDANNVRDEFLALLGLAAARFRRHASECMAVQMPLLQSAAKATTEAALVERLQETFSPKEGETLRRDQYPRTPGRDRYYWQSATGEGQTSAYDDQEAIASCPEESWIWQEIFDPTHPKAGCDGCVMVTIQDKFNYEHQEQIRAEAGSSK